MALSNLLKLVTGTALKRRTWQEICHDLLRLKDEATVLRLASELLSRYEEFDADERLVFFRYLLTEFRVDQDRLRKAIDAYQKDSGPLNVQKLNRASLPARRGLFEILNICPNGTHALLRMRVDLQACYPQDQELRAVDADLESLFRNWFNRGFLTLERVDWSTPAYVLEQLIEYEAVHEITGWDDLRRRLSTGRRCYAFFHPTLPGEPIIFVQVALVQGLVDSVKDVIGEDNVTCDEELADTAIFYSISNCQRGLVGIAFGDFLIKQVAERIRTNLPQIKQFATLSPVPGLCKWLKDQAGREANEVLEAAELDLAQQVTQGAWHSEDDDEDTRNTLLKLCAHYLVNEKRGEDPLDAVARFHLRNGARLERINWMGDPSPKGLGESCGILVNYAYDLDSVTENHEAYVYEHGVVCSNAVRALAKR